MDRERDGNTEGSGKERYKLEVDGVRDEGLTHDETVERTDSETDERTKHTKERKERE